MKYHKSNADDEVIITIDIKIMTVLLNVPAFSHFSLSLSFASTKKYTAKYTDKGG